MPKMKTKKALKSRFKVTGTGKVLRGKKGKRHILEKKSRTKKLKLKNRALLSKAYAKLYKNLMQEV